MSISFWRKQIPGLKRTWKQFRSSKLGLIGVAIIIFFIILALLAPFLTSNNPVTGTDVAAAYAVPSWARIFPWYAKYPVNSQLLQGTSLNDQSSYSHWTISVIGTNGSTDQGNSVRYAKTSSGLVINFTASSGGSGLNLFSNAGSPALE